ncbi:MAG: 6-carboxytetrahydropterin synthase QueD [Spirochaetota bacterium]
MYRLKVFDHFSSAHFLNGYKGKCESLHGHNWKVEAEVEGEKLDNLGMLIDFKILRKLLGEILKEMDHRLLNDMDVFKNSNPSAELIAEYIYNKFRQMLPEGVTVSSISVWETERSQAIYFKA